MSLDTREFHDRTQQLERLVQRVQSLADENARATALDLMRSVMDLHSAVLARVIELAVDGGEAGRDLLGSLCTDPMISGLLVLYGLHPLKVEERVAAAIEKVRSDVLERSGNVELLSVSESAVRLRIQSPGNGCGSSADVVRATIEQAIYDAAPEITAIEVEGASAAAASGFVPLTALQAPEAQRA